MDLRQHIFIILCLAGLSILQAQPISFLPPAAVAGGGLEFPIPANSLAVADFNGDGKADLVVIGNSNAGLWFPPSVSLGNGDGTFQPALTVIPSALVYSVVAADFNGDGNQDIAVIEELDGLTVPAGPTGVYLVILLGNGDGTFRALPTPLSGPASQSRWEARRPAYTGLRTTGSCSGRGRWHIRRRDAHHLAVCSRQLCGPPQQPTRPKRDYFLNNARSP